MVGSGTGTAPVGSSAAANGGEAPAGAWTPRAEGLNQRSYRSYRRRLRLFTKKCQRRGRETEVEGAFLAVTLLQDSAWEATEQLDLDDAELGENPFSPIFKLLDKL